ncbi:hypothetical protein Gpo141_00001721 [Globisporangium polare]
MVATRHLAVALASVCVAAGWRTAEGVKACADCTGTTCILEDTATKLTAGSSQLALKLCNYAAASAYTLEFSLKVPLACDSKSVLVPKLKSLAANGACNGAECPVTATLESPIDWAVAMRSGADVNAVMAKFTSGGSAEVVTVAIGQDIGGAAMQAPNASTSLANISVCSSSVAVSALRLSQADGCNTADICRGKAGDTACSIAVKQGLPITGITCSGENCSGKIALSGALTCDASAGDSNTMIVAVKVGNSAMSNYQGVGKLTAPVSTITDIDDLDAGSARFTVNTDSYCPSSAVQVSVTNADGASVGSVTSVNTTDGSIAVTLSSPIASNLNGKKLKFTLTECSVTSPVFTSTVGDDDDGSDSTSASGSTEDSSGNSGGVAGGGMSSTGTGNVSTQETNVSTGLSGGLIVGIAVGVLAFLGFAFECWYHKRRQTPAQPSNNDVPVTSSYGHNAI